jgi:hypothetical protein
VGPETVRTVDTDFDEVVVAAEVEQLVAETLSFGKSWQGLMALVLGGSLVGRMSEDPRPWALLVVLVPSSLL